MSIRIGLITTLNVNFGDDLVREGICLVLEEIFKDKNIEFIPICKHEPLTAYPLWHPLRHIHGLIWPFIKRRVNARRIIEKIARPISKMGFSKFDECDMIVQCGAPVMWNGCAKSEWSEFLWHQIVGRLGSSGKPVLNIGGGSCYPWERQPDSVTDEKDVFFLKKIFSYCKITTVRDKLAQRIFNSLDCDCPLIACPALIAGGSITAEGSGDFVLVNYMKKGGHYDFDQDIDESIWRNTFISVIERFKKRHKLLFLCHNQEEYKLAYEIDPGIPRFIAKDIHEYYSLIKRSKVGLCNRLHAAVALAGLGIPSVSVGTDTRLLMIETLNLPYFYVKEVNENLLEHCLQQLLDNRVRERERLIALRGKTWLQYAESMRKIDTELS